MSLATGRAELSPGATAGKGLPCVCQSEALPDTAAEGNIVSGAHSRLRRLGHGLTLLGHAEQQQPQHTGSASPQSQPTFRVLARASPQARLESRAMRRMASDDGGSRWSGDAHSPSQDTYLGPRSGDATGATVGSPRDAMHVILSAVHSRHGSSPRAALVRRGSSLSRGGFQTIGDQQAPYVEEQARPSAIADAALRCQQDVLQQLQQQQLCRPPSLNRASESGSSSPNHKSENSASAAASPRLRRIRISKTGSADSLPTVPFTDVGGTFSPHSPPGKSQSIHVAPRGSAPSSPSCLGSSRMVPADLAAVHDPATSTKEELGREAVASGPSLTTLIEQGSPSPMKGRRAATPSRLGTPSRSSPLLRLLNTTGPPAAGMVGEEATPAAPAALILMRQPSASGHSRRCPTASFSFPNASVHAAPCSPDRPYTPCASPPPSPAVSAPLNYASEAGLVGEDPASKQGLQPQPPTMRIARLPRVSMPNLSDTEPSASMSRRMSTFGASSPGHSPTGDDGESKPSFPFALAPHLHSAREYHRSGSLPGMQASGEPQRLTITRQLTATESFPLVRAHRSSTSWNGSFAQQQPSELHGSCSGAAEPTSTSRFRTGANRSPSHTRGVSPERQDEVRPPATGLHALLDVLRDGLGGSRRQRESYSGGVGPAASSGGGSSRVLPKLPSSTGRALHHMSSSRVDKAKQDRTTPEATRAMRSELMLGTYMSQANAAWAERQGVWLPAKAIHRLDYQDGGDALIYKAEAVKKLRAGQVVFQFFAAEDELSLPSGGSLDLWTSDPWALVAAARPGTIPLTGECLEGLSLGGRALTQLRMAVEAAAGADAVSALTVVLHIHEGQREAVLQDLCNRRHYGLRPENVFITVQQRRGGYRFDAFQHQFVPIEQPEPDQHFSMGPGFAMMQLNWVADAFVLSEGGKCLAVKDTLLELFRKRNVEWILSRRIRDLSLHCPGGALDLTALAQVLHLREGARASIVTQAIATSNTATIRRLDSVLLTPNVSYPDTSLLSPSAKRLKHIQPVCELRCCETASASMVDALGDVRAQTGGEVLAGLHRYAFHLPSLANALAVPNVFRPKMVLHGSAVRATLELSDLTSAPRAKCMAMHTDPSYAATLSSVKDVDALVEAMLLQEQDASFWAMASAGPAM